MSKFKAVLEFEFAEYVKSKGYKVFTLIMMLIALLGGLIPNIISSLNFGGNRENPPIGIHDVYNVFSDDSLNNHLGEGEWVRTNITQYEDIEKELENETYSHIFMVDGDEYTLILLGSTAMTFQAQPYNELIRENYIILNFSDFGYSPLEIREILNTTPDIGMVMVGRDVTQTFIIGYIMSMILYMAIMFYSQFVVVSVVKEKSTKTMEMLVVSVKSTNMIFGKVLGVALAGLLQLTAILGAAAIGLAFWGDSLAESNPMFALLNFREVAPVLGWSIIFFLLGFFCVAFVSAAIGSTLDKMEDVGQGNMISVLVSVVALLIAMGGISTPNATYMVVTSMIPILSPIIMFIRICLTEVPIYQIAISVIGNFIAIILLGILSAKIYRTGVLMYGIKPSFKNIIKSLRA